jgi:myotubularin-related protein 1/2
MEKAGAKAAPHRPAKIMDLRPRASAMANRTGGYGYENTSNYLGCTLQFCNNTNIHGDRDANQKLSSLCISPTTSVLTWASSIEETIDSQCRLRSSLLDSCPSAARLVALLAWVESDQSSHRLLLDPYFRTREGFACVVENDFMSFGHPFHTRCAHGEGRGNGGTSSTSGSNCTDEGQISPIFIQFLHCVYQLDTCIRNVEFNTRYLLLLSERVHSCRFGNLLCDTERELVAGIRQRVPVLAPRIVVMVAIPVFLSRYERMLAGRALHTEPHHGNVSRDPLVDILLHPARGRFLGGSPRNWNSAASKILCS